MKRSTVPIFEQPGRSPRRVRRSVSGRGLTFIELMFATMILGVGMIIIAAAFPVAIAEQRATLDDAAVAGVERSAARTLDAAVRQQAPMTMPWLTDTADGQVSSFGADPALWKHIAGDLICQSNGRYAWTALYARRPYIADPVNQTSITFFIVTLVSRENAAFDETKINDLKPSKVKITYTYKGTTFDPGLSANPDEDTIKIEDGDVGGAAAAVEGAFIVRGVNVRGADGSGAYPLYPQNAIIKLGTQFKEDEMTDPSTRIFRIAPGFEMNVGDVLATDMNGALAWAIGHNVTTTGTANRAMSCRAVTVQVKLPG